MVKQKNEETRGTVTIRLGTISKSGKKIGTVMHELKHGYHPVIRLRLNGEAMREFETDTPKLMDKIFKHTEEHGK